jgi:hypothetical protein
VSSVSLASEPPGYCALTLVTKNGGYFVCRVDRCDGLTLPEKGCCTAPLAGEPYPQPLPEFAAVRWLCPSSSRTAKLIGSAHPGQAGSHPIAPTTGARRADPARQARDSRSAHFWRTWSWSPFVVTYRTAETSPSVAVGADGTTAARSPARGSSSAWSPLAAGSHSSHMPGSFWNLKISMTTRRSPDSRSPSITAEATQT